ncbi:M4 family metallopeptidase [Catellatospora sichuanensis]|uniref:M4 family metallopeptidase n=1 Tax=Catellatospora sichuanensis TaxID=1969805 RepID=UPI0011824C05|nr:M4 family metallopeptidase [Catellatospora sichuanensis]
MRRVSMALAAVLLCGSAVALTAPAQAAGSPEDAAIARAQELIRLNPAAVRAAEGDRYEVFRAAVTRTGSAHVRFTRLFQGLPVVGGDFVVHVAPDGALDGVSVSLDRPVAVGTEPRVTAGQAAATARDALRATGVGTPQLIVDGVGGTGRLAWRLPVTMATGETEAVVDAVEPRVLRTNPLEHTAIGTGHSIYGGQVSLSTTQTIFDYRTIDPLRGNSKTCDMQHTVAGPCVTFTDADNIWGDGNPATNQSAAVDVHYGSANTWDFYLDVLGRHGIFDDGVGTTSQVHRDVNWANASWSATQKVMRYGDGSNGLRPLVSLDVVAHEMSHGVTQAVGGLIYAGESGGLNEGTSDILGTMAEFYANNAVDTPDYLLGEEIDIWGTGDPLRYLYQPSLDGISKDCWYNGIGNLDPHFSSGVANHFFFLAAEGSGATPYGTSPTCNGSSVVGIGRDRATQIWYHALTNYFTSDETFAEARADTLAATADLYGRCGSTYRTVAMAWAAVGVGTYSYPWKLCTPKWNLVWEEWPQPPILDPGPIKWITKVQERGTLEVAEVAVNLTHPRRGDLRLELVSPAGRTHLLKAPDAEDRAADLTEVYQVRLGGVAEVGEWTLVVEDVVKGEQSHLRGWSLLH